MSDLARSRLMTLHATKLAPGMGQFYEQK